MNVKLNLYDYFTGIKPNLFLLLNNFLEFIKIPPKLELWIFTLIWLIFFTLILWKIHFIRRRKRSFKYYENSEKTKALLYGYIFSIIMFSYISYVIWDYTLILLKIPHNMESLVYIFVVLGHIPVLTGSWLYHYTYDSDYGSILIATWLGYILSFFFGILLSISILMNVPPFFYLPHVLFLVISYTGMIYIMLPNYELAIMRPPHEIEQEYSSIYGYVLPDPLGDDTVVEVWQIDDFAEYHDEDEDWAEEFETKGDLHYSMNIDMIETSNEDLEIRKYGSTEKVIKYLWKEHGDVAAWTVDVGYRGLDQSDDFELYYMKRAEFGQTGVEPEWFAHWYNKD